MTAIRIAPVTNEDRMAWTPLWQGYQRFYEVDLSDEVTDALWSRALDPAEPVFAALAWDGERPLGLVHYLYHRNTWTVGNSCYLNDLFVLPETRGRGLGRALILYCHAEARAAGCETVYWHTHETNSTARALYDRIGKRSGFLHYAMTDG